ncbi:MAG: hypothetical protein ACD_19C00426G0156 [uncultured bacterium]|nr:MAG: hypothetical protein ACD_19C00426G0156 [uncultured bacterium]
MRKEVVYAIVAGISIGLIAAFGTWRVSKMVKHTPPPTERKYTPTPKNITNLLIDNLKDYDVVTENPTIKGVASPNTDIIISTHEKDFYTKSDSEGEFEKLIEIPAGISEVKINEIKLTLIYSTEVETGRIAYVGTITDISAGNIQIKNNSGAILQISINEDAKFINSLKKNIEVKETDLAIGDYIVAIGTVNGNKVLHSERILITSPLSETKIEVEKITIEKLSKTYINDIKLPTKWVGPNVKELEVGQEIYVIGIRDEKSYTLRSIFIPVE